jgi:hypothetical protein
MPSLEYEVRALPLDANLPGAMDKLTQEGWTLMPGIVPVGIYYLVKMPQQPGQPLAPLGAKAEMIIDDSKVHVIGPDGKRKS